MLRLIRVESNTRQGRKFFTLEVSTKDGDAHSLMSDYPIYWDTLVENIIAQLNLAVKRFEKDNQ